MEPSPSRVEAERLLGIAEKLLHNHDLVGSRDFAVLAQETDPLLDGSDQILAVADVLLASDKRINNHHDWYSILQMERRSEDSDLIKKQYRKLALLLHPDKNKFPFADHAFNLVADAWAVLSDSSKKSLYDDELTLFDLSASSVKLPVRRNQPSPSRTNNPDESRLASFWTACPYCYTLFEYPRVYEGCCLRCQKCRRAFHAAVIPSLPPLVPGQEGYYCCWGFFPMGYVMGNSDGAAAAGFPNWMPPMFPNGDQQEGPINAAGMNPQPVTAIPSASTAAIPPASALPEQTVKKRGRPKKYF